ncbi:hypothetical protein BOTU111921_11315 [Bordetella tumbae]|uniref:hypothetical protein n=1 Tax=Bordetella tumbae TaxID=1649139 RepID=UPI0039F0AED9
MELIAGFYMLAILILGFVLERKRGTPFPLTYSWGIALAFVGTAVYQSTTRADIDLTTVTLAVFTTMFAAYITANKGM